MPFSKLVGHKQIRASLEATIASHRIPTTFLFEGADGVGKKRFAYALAACLLGPGSEKKIRLEIHPDLFLLGPEGKSNTYSIERVRSMKEEAYLPPLEAKGKVFILDEAEKMSSICSNALLKLIEEPPEKSYFILITTEKEALLPTVISRARTYSFAPLLESEIEEYLLQEHKVSARQAKECAFLAHGSLARALLLLKKEQNPPWKEPLFELLLLNKEREYPEFLKCASKIEELLAEKGQQEEMCMLEEIAMWYRDLHLLSVKGNRDYLYHIDQLALLEKRLSRPIPPLELVWEALTEVRIGRQRSIHLAHLFESCFDALR